MALHHAARRLAEPIHHVTSKANRIRIATRQFASALAGSRADQRQALSQAVPAVYTSHSTGLTDHVWTLQEVLP